MIKIGEIMKKKKEQELTESEYLGLESDYLDQIRMESTEPLLRAVCELLMERNRRRSERVVKPTKCLTKTYFQKKTCK